MKKSAVSLSQLASVRLTVSRAHSVYVEDTERQGTGDFFNPHVQYSWKKLALALYYLDETETIGVVSGKLYDSQASLPHRASGSFATKQPKFDKSWVYFSFEKYNFGSIRNINNNIKPQQTWTCWTHLAYMYVCYQSKYVSVKVQITQLHCWLSLLFKNNSYPAAVELILVWC